jgi:S-adenosylmethionine:tRNA ribosyltransferase-isomerase
MKTTDFDYNLPPELIAQTPAEPRDSSRLLVLNRKDGSITHRRFYEITEYLRKGDVMVFNDSRVLPARLKGKRIETGGKVEILLLRRLREGEWQAMVKPARRLLPGERIELIPYSGLQLKSKIIAEIVGAGESGLRTVRIPDEAQLPALGEMPLPPYIHTPLQNQERYQTVYSKIVGSAAAPTAGLHFTPQLLKDIEAKGVRCVYTTLHVGLDTFRPVTEDDPREHVIHKEFGLISEEVAGEITKAKKEGRRVICVGTTSVRITEQAAGVSPPGKGLLKQVLPFNDWADLFILPGYKFKAADAMVTNFHLPKSTLLMLVTAFAGKENIEKAYREAIEQKYRFYSFGDATLIL